MRPHKKVTLSIRLSPVAAKVMAAFAFTVVLYCFMSLSFTFVFDGVKAAKFAGKNHRMISINSRN